MNLMVLIMLISMSIKRERAFEPDQPWSGMTQSQFRVEMQEERMHELCMENQKPDLVRWGIYVERIRNTNFKDNAQATNVQEKHRYAPIPFLKYN